MGGVSYFPLVGAVAAISVQFSVSSRPGRQMISMDQVASVVVCKWALRRLQARAQRPDGMEGRSGRPGASSRMAAIMRARRARFS